MSPIICNEWKIFFHPLFYQQWMELVEKVKKLKRKLNPEEFVSHADVKLLKAIDIGIRDKIPQDPFASHFALRKPLHRYGRLKKMGLPSRYRLFFRAFKDAKIIVILWLGFPRKEGDKKDCYQVFLKQVAKGYFPEDLENIMAELNAENSRSTEET